MVVECLHTISCVLASMGKTRAAVAILISEYLKHLENKKVRRKRRVRIKKWLHRRNSLGSANQLLSELRGEDPLDFKKYVKLSPKDFDDIIMKLNPLIGRQ